jgi:penicillin-insensitive murein endopeptidase
MRRNYRRIIIVALIGVIVALVWYQGSEFFRAVESSAPSESFGTPAAGHLVHGKRLPIAGENYLAYSRFGALLGRTNVDLRVRDTVLDACAQLAAANDRRVYQYGETGWPGGGRFWPHKSHENGMSVDFLLAARDANGPKLLSCWPWNQFCYGLHFDAQGKLGSLEMDRGATIAQLRALAAAAPHHGLKIKVVILDESLRDLLLAEPAGATLREVIWFNTQKPWIKHDQHFHADFEPL